MTLLKTNTDDDNVQVELFRTDSGFTLKAKDMDAGEVISLVKFNHEMEALAYSRYDKWL